MSALQIKLKEPVKSFVETRAAEAGCSPDDFVRRVLEDLEVAMEKRKLNKMLIEGYDQLRQGRGRVMTDADWEVLEKRIGKKRRRASK